MNGVWGEGIIVRVDDYIYLVPFVETESEIFLKTIIPSRKSTRKFRSKLWPRKHPMTKKS
jgi:hypothetical protein